jgi:hypothetical protein
LTLVLIRTTVQLAGKFVNHRLFNILRKIWRRKSAPVSNVTD